MVGIFHLLCSVYYVGVKHDKFHSHLHNIIQNIISQSFLHGTESLLTHVSHKIMIHYHVLDCEPLWFERYNMKGANGVLLRDRFGLDSCKSACVNNRACTSLHVYLNPRKGPSECWLNYESRGSSDPSSLLQSIRYLNLVLVDRSGASSQNASQGIVNRYMER